MRTRSERYQTVPLLFSIMQDKIIAFDQATKHTGYAIYAEQELVRYGVLHASGTNPFHRILLMFQQIYRLLESEQPSLVSIEGTQFQRNYQVYKELSQMQGVLFAMCFSLNIPFIVVEPSVWKHSCSVKGKNRAEQKASAMQIVRDMGIDAPEDACEAILHGQHVIKSSKG